MDIQWFWWIAAIVVVAAELMTGTVYLLMVALGLIAGGIAAWQGHSFDLQLFVAAAIAALGCFAVQRRRAQVGAAVESQRNSDVQIDLGNTVTVTSWEPDGTAQVQYRGASWSAKLDAGQPVSSSGLHRIVAMQGNTLVLKPMTV